MSATIIDGKAIAAEVRAALTVDVAAFTSEHGTAPGLATVLIGADPASAVYVGAKQKACAEVGIVGFDRRLPATTTPTEASAVIDALNADPAVSGILCQLPLPDQLDGVTLTNRIDAAKDVDGLTIASAGRLALGMPGLRPCTPSGVMVLLKRAGVDVAGASCVIIGRSNLFGKPMGQLLLAANATVTTCHSRTQNLAAVCRAADVVIAAAGVPEMVKGDWIAPGATVIDVGINRIPDSTAAQGTRLVGDVDFTAAVERAGAITPVPGGVGPMTIAMLLANTLQAASAQQAATLAS